MTGNGVDTRSTVDASDIEGCARLFRCGISCQPRDRSTQRVDGIRQAEIAPRVAARPNHLDAVTTRSERPICNAIQTRSIETDKRINLRSPPAPGEQVTNAAQVSLAFFSNRPDEQYRTLDRNLFSTDYLCESDQRSQTTAIVGDTRREEFVIASRNCEVSIFGKHRVEVGADNEQRRS